MKTNLLGFDIGGTKCAVIYGIQEGDNLTIVDKIKFATTNVEETIQNLLIETDVIMGKYGLTPQNTKAIGISCGGPLSSEKGIVMSPPNLPGWDNIPIVSIVEKRTGIQAKLQNDANASALAEWKFGAGKGSKNMIFLTFGTGLGAGLIINGELYAGTNDYAGEVGHVRLSDFGPIGYGKFGSFEGFASGSGIAQLARMFAKEKIQQGETISWCKANELEYISAKTVAEAAIEGDKLAKEIYETSARYLGKGLSMLIDILNPEVIVIGSIYARNVDLIQPVMQEVIEKETLPGALKVCNIRPALLGEQIGDYASLSIAATLK
jgi:glucokinase